VLLQQEEAAAGAKTLEGKRQELTVAAEVERSKMAMELSQLALAKDAAEQRSVNLERALANNKEASIAAADEVETQVRQRVSSLTSMLRLAEQQAESATVRNHAHTALENTHSRTLLSPEMLSARDELQRHSRGLNERVGWMPQAQARTKTDWVDRQRRELSDREKTVSATEAKLREREWSVEEKERKLSEQEVRQVALEASLKQREDTLAEQERALRVELVGANSHNTEVAAMKRQLEAKLAEVDDARRERRETHARCNFSSS
jgi:hypothetical protein